MKNNAQQKETVIVSSWVILHYIKAHLLCKSEWGEVATNRDVFYISKGATSCLRIRFTR